MFNDHIRSNLARKLVMRFTFTLVDVGKKSVIRQRTILFTLRR